MSINIHDKDFDLEEAAEYLIKAIEVCSKGKSNNDIQHKKTSTLKAI